jgi:hypothetical protein
MLQNSLSKRFPCPMRLRLAWPISGLLENSDEQWAWRELPRHVAATTGTITLVIG